MNAVISRPAPFFAAGRFLPYRKSAKTGLSLVHFLVVCRQDLLR